MAKQYLLKEGIPENAVLLEEQSAITQENLEYSLKIMNENSADYQRPISHETGNAAGRRFKETFSISDTNGFGCF